MMRGERLEKHANKEEKLFMARGLSIIEPWNTGYKRNDALFQ
jgi:hypothetical protein